MNIGSGMNFLENNNNINNTNNNSNKSIQQSAKKKSTPKKAEKKTKCSGNLQIDFLSTKRTRTEMGSSGLNLNMNNTVISAENNLNVNNNKEDSMKEQIDLQQIKYINNQKPHLDPEIKAVSLSHTEYQIVNIPMSITPNDNNQIDDAIEFSSKNVINKASFFKTKENTTIMSNFVKNSTQTQPNVSFSNNTNPLNQRINKSDGKINDFFNKVQLTADKKNPKENLNNSALGFSLNNINNLQTPESNYRIVKQIQDDYDKISRESNEMKKIMQEKEKEAEKMKNILAEHEESIKSLSVVNKQQDHLIQVSKFSLVKYLKELEEIKRNNKRKWINEQEFRLGKIVVSRVGNKTIDIWDQGEEITKLQNRYRTIEKEKDELERQKKNLANYLRKRTASNLDSVDPNTENELNDMKELINFKLNSYQREEIEIKEKLDRLETEKTLVAIESKRLREEETSRYASNTSKEKFPILANRYLILSLLGKGGYSEVYKAFDLENNIEVACKIHQLNNQWSDSIKENYIRHTIRENQIHKEICHSKIVRHYDTIEIDNNSFCTVLELCTGPDLHTYLKMHKTLPEKECRIIISQILYGLEYMNKLQKRIIHYDLQPQNIIFNNMEVKISDFGLAKIMDDNVDKIELTSQGVGTYWYLPPECFDTSRNPPGISSKVDIWSVGVILYELLYGIRPFGHSSSKRPTR